MTIRQTCSTDFNPGAIYWSSRTDGYLFFKQSLRCNSFRDFRWHRSKGLTVSFNWNGLEPMTPEF